LLSNQVRRQIDLCHSPPLTFNFDSRMNDSASDGDNDDWRGKRARRDENDESSSAADSVQPSPLFLAAKVFTKTPNDDNLRPLADCIAWALAHCTQHDRAVPMFVFVRLKLEDGGVARHTLALGQQSAVPCRRARVVQGAVLHQPLVRKRPYSSMRSARVPRLKNLNLMRSILNINTMVHVQSRST
jgi:hypothetical protein